MNQSSNNTLVISYLNLRQAVGYVGMALPFALILGRMLQGDTGLLDSISGYYYSGMRDVFVGALWSIGIFLFSYRGYDWKDNIWGTLACFAAIGVAVFPTTPGLTATPRETTIGYIHLIFAAAFFGIMAYFCLKLFTRGVNPANQTSQKRTRNKVYMTCGWTIVACIILMFLLTFVPTTSPIRELNPVLWLETIAVEAFGISWFVKGEGILKDNE